MTSSEIMEFLKDSGEGLSTVDPKMRELILSRTIFTSEIVEFTDVGKFKTEVFIPFFDHFIGIRVDITNHFRVVEHILGKEVCSREEYRSRMLKQIQSAEDETKEGGQND